MSPDGRRRLLLASTVAIAAGYAVLVARPLFDARDLGNTDVVPFATGWRLVATSPGTLYDLKAQADVQRGLLAGGGYVGGVLPFLHPPHAALALAPLGALSLRALHAVLLILSLGAALALVQVVRKLAQVPHEARWLAAAAVLGFPPLLDALQMGQLSVFLALALGGFLLALREGRERTVALCLLALSCKPQLLPPCLAYLFLARRVRALAWSAALAAAVGGVTTWALGTDVWPKYAHLLVEIARLPEGSSGAHPGRVLSLYGVLGRGHLVEGAAGPVAGAILVAAATGVAAWLGGRARTTHARRAGLATALAMAVMLACSPHLYVYDATLWVPVMAAGLGTLRGAGDVSAPAFARFALVWPHLFLVAALVETAWPGGLAVPPGFLPPAWATLWWWRCYRLSAARPSA